MKERNGDGGDVDANPEIKRERGNKRPSLHTRTHRTTEQRGSAL